MSMFLLPRAVPVFQKPEIAQNFTFNKGLLRTDHSRQNFIMITEKSVLDDDQLAPVKYAVIILLMVIGYCFTAKKISFVPYKFQRYPNKRYSYLSFRTIRI
jgi:hypothetical protein